MAQLETRRLVLRSWRSEDLEPFAALNADPEVMRYLGGVALTREQSDALADRIMGHFQDHGFGLWAAEVVGEASMTGFIGLAYPTFLPEVMPTVEVGWRLAHPFWGKGLATEGAMDCVSYAFEDLQLDEICSIHLPENVASRRVMEKLGMSFDRDTVRPDDGTPVRVFKLGRDAWRGLKTRPRRGARAPNGR